MSSEASAEPIQHLISVVIVNYNGLRFLSECLSTLSSQAFLRYPYEIIVVDNASSDGSQDFLRHYPGITYIESPVNTGFTGGNNIGVKAAKGDIVFLLNNDTRVETCLDPMIEELLKPAVGVVGCQLRYGDGRIQFSTGHEHTPLRVVFSWLGVEKWSRLPTLFRRLETHIGFYERPHRQLAWVSGAALMTRTVLWRQLQGLDEAFFMYCEDVDYCRRVRDKGFSISYLPQVRITHYEGAGKEWIGRHALLRTTRSYTLYVAKHFGLASSRLMACGLSVIFLLRALAFHFMSGIASEANRRRIFKEKAGAFHQAGKTLMHSASCGQPPKLP